MMNFSKFEKDNYICVADMKISYSDKYDFIYEVSEVSKRFLQTSALISQGTFIGCQICKKNDNHTRCNVFSSKSVNISVSDFDWIFHGCAVADDNTDLRLENLFEKGRKVYVLASIKGCMEDVSETKVNAICERNDNYFGDDEYYDSEIKRHFTDLFNTLMESNAVIQLIAGASKEKSFGHGILFISTPKEMSLKLKSIISIAFPHMLAKEIYSFSEISENLGYIPDEYFLDSITHFIYNMDSWEKKIEGDDESQGNGECYEDTYMDLDKLDTDFEDVIEEKDIHKEGLHELIGLEEVKTQVNKIIAFAKLKKEMKEKNAGNQSMVLNMEFTGNPGTAKTTVARILGEEFYDIGLTSRREVVEIGRADLVAEYTGQTAVKTKKIFEKARGGILFIDEAYSLVEDNHSFGDEAITTIVQEMENNRDDIIVIFAGYPEKMEDFFKTNPGLRSRVPFKIIFADYSIEDMLKIVKHEADKRGFNISPSAETKILSICESALEYSENGNGRFCRNLVENAILEFAERVYGASSCLDTEKEGDGYENRYMLLAKDFILPRTIVNEKRIKLGFAI